MDFGDEFLEVDTGILNIADFALDVNLNYKIIKQHNPWILGNKISNNNKKKYLLQLPSTKYDDKKDTIIYTCQSRENLFEIARKHNIQVDELLLWNNLSPSQKLKKHQNIIVNL